MKQLIDLKPEIVWKYFYEVTQIPRPSKKEGKIIRYLNSFAAEHGLDIRTDAAGNVLICKPATPGYEHRPTVILQSHLDMVCEKHGYIVHDFDNDPILPIVDGEWVRANGTTLGADNGIGVAAELAILASDNLQHGALECLFTVDEETGLTGASALRQGFMTGNILLNLDSEDEGELFIGCAGGKNTTGTLRFTPSLTSDRTYFRIGVSGLRGGHSGCDIHKGLGNAIKILVRFLHLLNDEWRAGRMSRFVLATLEGGKLHNAIPRESSAVIGLQESERETVRILLNHFAVETEEELRHVDPSLRLTMETVDPPAFTLSDDSAACVINMLTACPHGVIAMSHEMEGLVETSTNLAAVKTTDDHRVVILTSQRSALESGKKAAVDQVSAVFGLGGAEVEQSDGYPGWAPDTGSAILRTAQETYRRLFGREAKVKAIHAGLECGLFREKYPALDMVSFGPTLRDVHSPNERIEIATVGLWWRHLLEILKEVGN